ncbi:MAG: SOS response-associated peptidase family protein, partial [Bacteriovoracaceae bacterium]|nr:SOS response-associated peptidase family protein [Bacteriovoracaceae bacterium]
MCFSVQIDRNLNRVANRFGAEVHREAFLRFNELKEQSPKIYKAPDEQNRIFPNYHAPIILKANGKRILKPMRYRVRPQGSSEEVPSKYNLFNARIDALESRKTWQPLFMSTHCLFPFTNFFEWVVHEGKKKLITFKPEEKDIMWAPALYDVWKSRDGNQTIESFALITNDPPPEIERMGHDRCPIFLKEEYIEDWLSPENETRDEVYEMLNEQESV